MQSIGRGFVNSLHSFSMPYPQTKKIKPVQPEVQWNRFVCRRMDKLRVNEFHMNSGFLSQLQVWALNWKHGKWLELTLNWHNYVKRNSLTKSSLGPANYVYVSRIRSLCICTLDKDNLLRSDNWQVMLISESVPYSKNQGSTLQHRQTYKSI